MATEKERAYQKQYYQANKEVLQARQKSRRQENPERQREYQKLYYEQHPEKLRERDTRRKQKLREFILQQKKSKSCVRCGNADFRVLDFHHLDKGSKELSIGDIVADGWSEKRILQEIAKCQVLCANCHRIVHWEERNEVDSV